MKAVFAGSTDLPLAESANHLLQQLASLPMDATVLLRRGRGTYPGAFERLAASLCDGLKIPVEWKSPDVGGRKATFIRDIDMVQESDLVVCYFHPDRIMDGGTGHIAEKALDQDKPLNTYTVRENAVDWVGGNDPIPLEMRG